MEAKVETERVSKGAMRGGPETLFNFLGGVGPSEWLFFLLKVGFWMLVFHSSS